MSNPNLTFNRFPELAAKAPRAVGLIVRKTANDYDAEMQRLFELPKHGAFREVSATGKLHRASAPGEAPAVDTGNLRNSIAITMINNGLTARIDFGAEYAFWLEFGRRSVAARPFARPALEAQRPAFIGALKALEAHLR
jgi:hypothetical protein